MKEKAVRIPFDSFNLAAALAEVSAFVGGRVQDVRQPTEHEVAIALYGGGKEAMLLLSAHPQFARLHLVARRPPNQPQPPAFCAALRARLVGSSLRGVRQIDFDRIAHFEFQGADGIHLLVAELMGKHSNLILVDAGGRIVSAARWIGRSKSVRPIQPNTPYRPPPFPPKPSLLDAGPEDDLSERAGASPFLLRLLKAEGAGGLEKVQTAAREGSFTPVYSPNHGAYPVSVAALGLPEVARPSIGQALEQHFTELQRETERETLRASLLGQLRRVVLAREVALRDLEQAEDLGRRAGELQRRGELVLAYGPSAPAGTSQIEAWDYEGNPVTLELDPEKDFKENAQALFERAKKAKARLGLVQDQIRRLGDDRTAVEALMDRIEKEERLDRLRELREEALAKRWLTVQALPTTKKEDRPYEGHRIRELIGPQGLTILYGENAESNDYLTLRVAKPNDWWVHVRGGISAHVVIVTKNQPEKVAKETILYAAKIAVQNSPSKHSGYVPVDYTLKKYVRKPKGAPKGTALYTHEKTLHVEGGS
jgi:predicted ribosome quality control (RQC) complex YloA/Tae2 family protein